MNKEQIEKAASEAQEEMAKRFIQDENFQPTFINAFKSGADWRINSVWHNQEDTLEDGEYLTVLKRKRHGGYSERIFVEVAPWRNGEYHGSNHMGVAIGQIEVVMCANINDLLPNVSELDRLKVREKMTTEEIEIKEINYL